MELRDYLRILRKRWWIIVLIAALTTAAAYGFSAIQTPVYKSTVRLSVWPARIDNGAQLAAKALLRAFAVFADSDTFAARVINTLQLDLLPDRLNEKVTIASVDEDFIIQIEVLDTDPQIANAIARVWAEEFVAWRKLENDLQRKEDRVEARIVQPPAVGKFRPQTTLNTAAGGIIGLLLGGLLVYALEWIESGVLRTPDDVERAMGMSVLGAIPQTK
ncbi:MAG TPA: Wzz/FepE/Etk N-terminal domain-containing protein [Anaerolineae bacterium]|nr:Wzz/FepE/Etk N-terminal domain-containing protein [Anaerolineae bacterium]